jgi:hypothetical protein
MDVTPSSHETRRRGLRVIGVTAACGIVVMSAAFLALRISSMMPSVIEEPVKAIPPAPAASRRLAEAERPQPAVPVRPVVTEVRRQPPRQQIPPASRATSDPLTEAERTRRTASWLLRTYDRETAEKYVRDAIAFYPVEDRDGAFWRQVLTKIAAGVDR